MLIIAFRKLPSSQFCWNFINFLDFLDDVVFCRMVPLSMSSNVVFLTTFDERSVRPFWWRSLWMVPYVIHTTQLTGCNWVCKINLFWQKERVWQSFTLSSICVKTLLQMPKLAVKWIQIHTGCLIKKWNIIYWSHLLFLKSLENL